VRPGVIAGPADAANRFSWWVARLARGGRVLAPGPPERPVALIDARDLAAWMLAMARRGAAGIFNAVGRQHTMAEVLEACRTDTPAELVWVGEDELLGAGIEPWSQLPLWISSREREFGGFFGVDGSRAFAAGLPPRPLADTARDTLAALRRDGEPIARGRTIREPGLDPTVEAQLIGGR
jgi:2'-hydroxyisoflavone reductase